MNMKLLKGLPRELHDEFKQQYKESRTVIEQLVATLEAELEESIRETSKKDKFYMPAWSEYVAHRLGEQEALRTVINLLKD